MSQNSKSYPAGFSEKVFRPCLRTGGQGGCERRLWAQVFEQNRTTEYLFRPVDKMCFVSHSRAAIGVHLSSVDLYQPSRQPEAGRFVLLRAVFPANQEFLCQ